jgi:hypothetical protein
MRRREYLTTTLGLGVAALAGCTTASGSVPSPTVDQSRLSDDGWELTDDVVETVFEREFAGAVTVTATAHTVTYEDRALQAALAEKTLGNIDFAPASFFATRVEFAPSIDRLPAGAGRKELMAEVTPNARDSFEERLGDLGLTDVEERDETTLEIDTGETADAFRYRGTYPFDSFDLQLNADRRLTIEGGELPVDGWLAAWHHDSSVLVSGGGYPAGNVERSVEQSLTSAIDVSVEIDLELEPDAYREDLLALMTGVE